MAMFGSNNHFVKAQRRGDREVGSGEDGKRIKDNGRAPARSAWKQNMTDLLRPNEDDGDDVELSV